MAVNAQPSGQRGPVLVGFAEALAAIETVWSLLEAGFEVVAFTRRGGRPPLARCAAVRMLELTPPEVDARATTSELRAAVESLRPAAVLPADDVAVWLCARAVAGTEMPLAGPAGERERLALDKRLQLDRAAAAGLRVPPTRRLESAEEAFEGAAFPLVIKPALAVAELGGRLVRGRSWVCADRFELQAATRAFEFGQPALVQPLLHGTGEGMFGLADAAGVHAWSAHRRVRMVNPEGSGSSACATAALDERLVELGERMMRDAGWRGMFMLEFLRDANGQAWFMELNGRPWGSMALARRVGLEYPAWAVRQALNGLPPAPPRPAAPLQVTARHAGRELMHLATVIRGPRSRAMTAWPARRQVLRDVITVRREDRLYNWRRGDLAVFFDDAARTVIAPLIGRLPGRG